MNLTARLLLLILYVATLSGCVATNLVEHYARKNFRQDKIHQNAIREIKQVKLKASGDVEICIVGNQLVENSDHTIYLKNDMYTSCGFGVPILERKQYRKRSCPEYLNRNIYQAGCDLTLSEGDRELVRKPNCCESHTVYFNEKRLPFEEIHISNGNEHGVSLSLKYPKVEVDPDACNPYKGKKQGDQIQAWIPLCDAMYPPRTVIDDDLSISIDPGPPKYPPSHPTANKIAFLVDVITAPIQWTLCLLTWGTVCSEPYMGSIVPG